MRRKPPKSSPPQPFLDARPVPDRRPIQPTAEEFAVWTRNPVTEWVAAQYERMALSQRDVWMAASWGEENIDPRALRELRTRADCYMAFLETGWERYAAISTEADR